MLRAGECLRSAPVMAWFALGGRRGTPRGRSRAARIVETPLWGQDRPRAEVEMSKQKKEDRGRFSSKRKSEEVRKNNRAFRVADPKAAPSPSWRRGSVRLGPRPRGTVLFPFRLPADAPSPPEASSAPLRVHRAERSHRQRELGQGSGDGFSRSRGREILEARVHCRRGCERQGGYG